MCERCGVRRAMLCSARCDDHSRGASSCVSSRLACSSRLTPRSKTPLADSTSTSMVRRAQHSRVMMRAPLHLHLHMHLHLHLHHLRRRIYLVRTHPHSSPVRTLSGPTRTLFRVSRCIRPCTRNRRLCTRRRLQLQRVPHQLRRAQMPLQMIWSCMMMFLRFLMCMILIDLDHPSSPVSRALSHL